MTQEVKSADSAKAIAIASRLAEAEGFLSLFNHGMQLIEQTAEYLDGPGREDSKSLSRPGSIAYASESMRLTTRLMQIASWLLLQRAVNEGEMSATDGKAEKAKVRLGGMQPSMSGAGWDELPEPLKDMIERSQRLEDRVRHLDVGLGGQSFAESMETVKEEEPAQSALVDQMARLNAAFPDSDTAH